MYKFDYLALITDKTLDNITVRITDWQDFLEDPNAAKFLKVTHHLTTKHGISQNADTDYDSFVKYSSIIGYSPAQPFDPQFETTKGNDSDDS